MSLRYLINVRIALTSVFILLISSIVVIWQAQVSVKNELESSLNLAAQLIQLNYPSQSQTSNNINLDSWLSRFVSLKEIRHLTIELAQADGKTLAFSAKDQKSVKMDVPRFFVRLISTNSPIIEKKLIDSNGKPVNLIIKADPSDEITEAWQESCTLLLILLSMTVIIIFVVNLLFNRTFTAINKIIENLKSIENGDYQNKLPTFAIQEYDHIANTINHMSDVMVAANQENKALTRHTLKIQEEERQHLAKELHDELGQSLTAIKVMATTCKNSKADVEQIADTIVSVSDHLITVVRSMMRNLHPLVLSELGLQASLEDLLNHWSQRQPELGLTLNYSEDTNAMLTPELNIQIFRVCQECLTNVIRHAEATEAIIKINNLDNKTLELEIQDNGKGCDLIKLKKGFGLSGVRERIKSLGGLLTIETGRDQGLKIIARIPVA